MTDATRPAHLVDVKWTNPKGDGGFTIVITAAYEGVIRTHGKGTMDGSRAVIAAMNDALERIGTDHQLTGLVDLGELSGSPMRAQFMLGKWLLGHRKIFGQVVIFGGKAWERKLAKAIIAIARLGQNVTFLETEDEALAKLGWEQAPDRV